VAAPAIEIAGLTKYDGEDLRIEDLSLAVGSASVGVTDGSTRFLAGLCVAVAPRPGR